MINKIKNLFRKKKEVPSSFSFTERNKLTGNIHTGALFIGDAGYFADNPQNYEAGIVKHDPTNPFKDWDKFTATTENDCTVDLPGSFNGDLPGRGVVIQTNMLGGSYSVEKEVCPSSGKLLSVKVVFHE